MSTSTDRQSFRETVALVAEKAKAKLPECNGRVEKAAALVLQGDVELLPDGTARVFSQSNGITSYLVVNGHCDCRDFAQAPHGFCKHRLGAAIARRAAALAPQAPPAPAATPTPAVPGIDPRYLTDIQGRPFVRFEGLLALAHERGLIELSTTVVSVTSDLAVCQSTARFPEGRVFTDVGDASPSNVKRHLAPHFIRMAATRASARALRRALNVDAVAIEELGDDA